MLIRQQRLVTDSLAAAYASFGGMDIDFYGGPSIDELTENRLNESLLRNILKLGGSFEAIFIGDRNGLLFAGTTFEGERIFMGLDISGASEFQKVRETLDTTCSGVFKSERTGSLVMVFYAPIMNKKKVFSGILGLTMKMEYFSGLISTLRYGETGYAFMADVDGRIISHPRKEVILSSNIFNIQGIDEKAAVMKEGNPCVAAYTFEGVRKMGGFARIPSIGGYVAVSQDRDEWMAAAKSLRNLSMPLLGVVLIMASIGGGLVAHRIVTPIKKAIAGIGDTTTHSADRVESSTNHGEHCFRQQ